MLLVTIVVSRTLFSFEVHFHLLVMLNALKTASRMKMCLQLDKFQIEVKYLNRKQIGSYLNGLQNKSVLAHDCMKVLRAPPQASVIPLHSNRCEGYIRSCREQTSTLQSSASILTF